jgi:hypothetical protein|tara:strand:- start:123 stop:704 length:582 start_codon:yes stop_codon:yes gene_type:complete
MGSSSAATGGGGSGVPDMIRPPKIRRKEKFKESLKNFKPPVIGILEGLTKGITEKAKAANLKRRKAFIKKQGLTGDDINMSDDYLSSKEGLAELKKQGYTTVSDLTPSGNDNDGGGNQVGQTTTMAAATAPTTAEVSQSSATDATDVATVDTDDPTYIKRKNKRTGRSLTILTSSKGATDGLTLGKKSLLGQA